MAEGTECTVSHVFSCNLKELHASLVGCDDSKKIEAILEDFAKTTVQQFDSSMSEEKCEELCQLVKTFIIHMHFKQNLTGILDRKLYYDCIASLMSCYIDLLLKLTKFSHEASSKAKWRSTLWTIVAAFTYTIFDKSRLHIIDTFLQLQSSAKMKRIYLFPIVRQMISDHLLSSTPESYMKMIILLKNLLKKCPKNVKTEIKKFGQQLKPPPGLSKWLKDIHQFRLSELVNDIVANSITIVLLSGAFTDKKCTTILDSLVKYRIEEKTNEMTASSITPLFVIDTGKAKETFEDESELNLAMDSLDEFEIEERLESDSESFQLERKRKRENSLERSDTKCKQAKGNVSDDEDAEMKSLDDTSEEENHAEENGEKMTYDKSMNQESLMMSTNKDSSRGSDEKRVDVEAHSELEEDKSNEEETSEYEELSSSDTDVNIDSEDESEHEEAKSKFLDDEAIETYVKVDEESGDSTEEFSDDDDDLSKSGFVLAESNEKNQKKSDETLEESDINLEDSFLVPDGVGEETEDSSDNESEDINKTNTPRKFPSSSDSDSEHVNRPKKKNNNKRAQRSFVLTDSSDSEPESNGDETKKSGQLEDEALDSIENQSRDTEKLNESVENKNEILIENNNGSSTSEESKIDEKQIENELNEIDVDEPTAESITAELSSNEMEDEFKDAEVEMNESRLSETSEPIVEELPSESEVNNSSLVKSLEGNAKAKNKILSSVFRKPLNSSTPNRSVNSSREEPQKSDNDTSLQLKLSSSESSGDEQKTETQKKKKEVPARLTQLRKRKDDKNLPSTSDKVVNFKRPNTRSMRRRSQRIAERSLQA